jgi:hypothetical protein
MRAAALSALVHPSPTMADDRRFKHLILFIFGRGTEEPAISAQHALAEPSLLPIMI